MIRFRSAKSQNRRSRGCPTRSRCSRAVPRGCECSPTGMSFTPILCFSPICATCSTVSSAGCLMPNCRRPMRLRARDNFRMPPLDRIRFERDGAMDAVWERLLAMAEQVAMPDKARIALARLRVVDPARRNDFDWRRSGERNTARGAGRARVRGRSIAGALRPSCGAPRCRSAGAGRSRRLSRLWRSAGVHHGGRLEWSARDPLLRLLAVRDALELSAHQMRAVRLDRRTLRIKRLPADPRRSKPKPADPAVLTSR